MSFVPFEEVELMELDEAEMERERLERVLVAEAEGRFADRAEGGLGDGFGARRDGPARAEDVAGGGIGGERTEEDASFEGGRDLTR